MKKLSSLLLLLLFACSGPSENEEFSFKNSSFEKFYVQFGSDSIFQLEHVKFPMSGQYETYDEKRKWTKEEWEYMIWDFRDAMNDNDDSLSIIQEDNSFFYGQYCRDCGFSFEMKYEKIKGDWYLIHRQENNY